MIKTQFKLVDGYEHVWEAWPELSLFENIDLVMKKLKTKKEYGNIRCDNETGDLIAEIIDSKKLFYIRFYDTVFECFVKYESPWKIGLLNNRE